MTSLTLKSLGSTRTAVPGRKLTHPIRELQGPLEESITEAQDDSLHEPLLLLDPRSRRNQLLGADVYERICAGKWRQRKDEKYHPLWKTIAQLSFGVHLIAQGAAKSEADSVQKLQKLVDEMDGFVQRTSEDLHTAAQDIRKRIDLLEVPLRHLGVFDTMLKNPSFQQSISRINSNIRHVVERSFVAVQDSLKDVDKGYTAVNIFARYFQELDESSVQRSSTFEAVQATMAANLCGWNDVLLRCKLKGRELVQLLNWLSLANLEIQRRAAFASTGKSAGPIDVHPPSTPQSTQVPADADPDSVRRHLRLLWNRIHVSTDTPLRSRTKATLDKPLPSYPEPEVGNDDEIPGEVLVSYGAYDPQPGKSDVDVIRTPLEESYMGGGIRHRGSISFASSKAAGSIQTPVPQELGSGQYSSETNESSAWSGTSFDNPHSRGDPEAQSQLRDAGVKPDWRTKKPPSLSVETRLGNPACPQDLNGPKSTSGVSMRSPSLSINAKNYPKRKWSAVSSISSALRKRGDT